MTSHRYRAILALLIALGLGGLAKQAEAHPMGNFSISHYTAVTVHSEHVELRYLIDMAEIPTFQELQDNRLVADSTHPNLEGYLARKAQELAAGLSLDVNGRRLDLRSASRTVLFTPGAGDLPTMKLGFVYRAELAGNAAPGLNRLTYRDDNFPDRAGWKEIVAGTITGLTLAESSVPERDRSRQLSDYPTDLMNSPPQALTASLTFVLAQPVAAARTSRSAPVQAEPTRGANLAPTSTPVSARSPASSPTAKQAPATLVASPPPSAEGTRLASARTPLSGASTLPSVASAPLGVATTQLSLEPNRGATRRDRLSDLITTTPSRPRLLLFAALVAATLGAFHALEPGHGKTVVAAYLVGSRGTARHAMLLGLIVTASHTAGVFLLGAVTLYASRYVVPDRLYPWLGALSGLVIAVLGVYLFLSRYAGARHTHEHAHDHGHPHSHDPVHSHADQDHHGDGRHHHGRHRQHDHRPAGGTVSFRQLLALGVTGGIVPCPAALVVLLSAIALRRVGFGLFLIVAFSVGLAAVLIVIGLLMVHARRLMARVEGTGPVITRWLPLTSSAAITVLGVAIAGQALMSAGIITLRLG